MNLKLLATVLLHWYSALWGMPSAWCVWSL